MFGRRADDDGSGAVLAGAAAAAAALGRFRGRATAPRAPAGEAGERIRADPPPVEAGAAAFFDVDNTMMMGASIYHFARGLAARKFFTSRDLVAFGWQQVKFRVGGQESATDMADVREAALAFVAGREVADIIAYGEEIYDELMDQRIYPGTRALAQSHLDAGQKVWLVTATPIELARVVADRLGLSGALGTVSEVERGRYTGRLIGEPLHGPAKAEAVRALAEQEGLDLASCYAYSDSVNDLPMLGLVGHPTAVNPDPELRGYAKQAGWPIRDFRTGRKLVRVGIPAAGGAGMLAGAVTAGVVLRRRRDPPWRRWRRLRPARRVLRRRPSGAA